MSTRQTRKRKSDEIAAEEAVTPTGSPAPKRMKITEMQKQALIDNLRLEIAERARRLRAQYAVQCNDLRARIERRIHRVPTTMRNMTMADLMAKHEETDKPAPIPTVVSRAIQRQPQPASRVNQLPSQSPVKSQTRQPQASRPRKRKSSDIHIASDKENDHQSIAVAPEALPIVKNTKRTKTINATTRPASRAQKTRSSRGTAGILSPRSHNSRTLPRSPIKDLNHPPSPSKFQQQPTSFIARPVSPLKPNSPIKTAASAATSAISASVHGMIESARSKPSKPTRVTSKGTKTTTTTNNPRPTLRTVSAQSNHSTNTAISTISNTTIVITKPKRSAATTTAAASKNKKAAAATATVTNSSADEMAPPPAPKPSKRTGAAAAAAASKFANAAAGALKKTASGSGSVASSKSNVATGGIEVPATGKRVLRKRG